MSEKKTRNTGLPRGSRDGRSRDSVGHRLKQMRDQTLKPPIGHPAPGEEPLPDVALECGWGRLIFAQTFSDPERIIQKIQGEKPDRRDIAFYVRDPHVLLANAPQDVFLDPSHTYRLNLATYRASSRTPKNFFIRRLTVQHDADAINRLYSARGMVTIPPEFFWQKRDARALCYFVAEDEKTGAILGTVTGVDHMQAFNDPERGSSLWCLAVDPQASQPGLGEALVRRLAEYFAARGAAYMDLSVLHDNTQAIRLYEKLGFRRVPFFTVKRKNTFNETLYTAPDTDESLNAYAKIIVKEARRRGIHVDVTDAEGGFFRLSFGGRSVHCRESLSEFTTAVAMSI
ncbi:MAG: GNAT family N-acetyltransferase, partial [Flavobacteriaceae bacterium]